MYMRKLIPSLCYKWWDKLSQTCQPNKTSKFYSRTFFLSQDYLCLSLTPNEPLQYYKLLKT
uniref:Putative ovule protein n=1 Tax=Solanum chacoense TaxID=4108 RepID=A0A0V0HFL0_SOLCH